MALTHASVLPLLQPQQWRCGNHAGRRTEDCFGCKFSVQKMWSRWFREE